MQLKVSLIMFLSPPDDVVSMAWSRLESRIGTKPQTIISGVKETDLDYDEV
jgi:hypothetical protein